VLEYFVTEGGSMRLVPVFALLVLSAPAFAFQAADPATQPAAEKKICRSVAKTGSIMNKRECHTKAEWAEITARSVAAREKLDRDHGGRTGAIGLTSSNK
jgi:hypothetical protein